MTTAAALELTEVSKVYRTGPLGFGRLRALDRASLRVEAGESVGLAGPNRAGKTTLLKLALSLARPTAGRVARLGRPASDRSSLGGVGYVHEAPSFPNYLTAPALLDQYGALSGIPERPRRRRAAELIERVGLGDRIGDPIGKFSKGMVRRLGLAQALLNEPDLLVLDEPHEGLDLPGRDLAVDLIDDHRRRGGATLIVSHLLPDLDRLCDRVVVVVGGRVVADGPVGRFAAGPGGLEASLRALYRHEGMAS